MPVTEVKQALGSFTISLRPTTPQETLDALKYFGHIAVIEGRVQPAEYGDQLLSMARYVGVYRNRNNDVDNRSNNVDGTYQLRGVGMAHWLGDENGKGPVFETAQTFNGTTFANTIRALLPDAVAEGTLFSIAGTYKGSHQWVTPRQAIGYVCTMYEAEWRVNNNGTLDAGTAAQLYPVREQRPMLVKHGYGRDLAVAAYQGKIDSAEDSELFSTRVVVLASGEGSSIATGSANIGSNPYKDLFGNPVQITRVVSESATEPVNAGTRAQLELDAVSSTRRSLRLAANDYDVAGTLAVGEYVWVYDPDTGLVDPSFEVQFRGERVNPVKLRCSEMTWPIVPGMTVAYRSPDGGWWDLTDHVKFESQGDVSITIGDLPRVLTGGGGEPIGSRPVTDNSTPDTPTWDLPFITSPYLDGLGNTRAQVVLSWNQPLNVDGSTVLDGLQYEVRYGLHPATEWQSAFALWGTDSMLIQDLSPGLAYDIEIRAVDRYGNMSAWSTTVQITVAPDTLPPSTPAPPTVAGNRLSVQITHTLGKSTGGTYNLEADLDHLEVHVGATSTFTANATTLRGKVAANGGMILGQIPAVGTVPVEETTTRYVRVIAVDQAGNQSSPSTAASVTALLIDDAHIVSLTVDKISAGTLLANVILGASIRTASSGQRVELNASGVQMFNAAGTQLVSLGTTGVFFLRSGTSGARIDISTVTGLQIYNSAGTRTGWLDIDGSFELRTAASGARVLIDGDGIAAFNSAGSQTVDIDGATGSATFVGTISTGFSGRRVVVSQSASRVIFYAGDGTTNAFIAERGVFSDQADLILESSTDTSGSDDVKSRIELMESGLNLSYFSSTSFVGSPKAGISLYDFGVQLSWRGSSAHDLTCDNGGWKVNGTAIKSFIIDHPTDPDRWLVHACTESPHAGVEYWGETTLDDKGQATVTLPAYFEALTKPDGRYVAVNTCSDEIRNASATYPTDGRFTIHGGAGLRVTWLVKAIRAAADSMSVEPLRSEIDVHGQGPYLYATPTTKEPQHV